MPTLTRTQVFMLTYGLPIRASRHVTRGVLASLESLVTLGLASAHRASIGEVDEHAVYSITDAGRAAVQP